MGAPAGQPIESVAPAARGAGHWTFVAILWAGALGLLALRLLTSPAAQGHGTHVQLGLPACGMMRITGWPCPGCGVTTALSHAAHGDFGHAFAVQPFGALLAVSILAASAWAIVESLRGRDAWVDFRAGWRPWMAWTIGAALAASWIYKVIELG